MCIFAVEVNYFNGRFALPEKKNVEERRSIAGTVAAKLKLY